MGGTNRTITVELEVDLTYEGLSDPEIRRRCNDDAALITEAIHRGERPALPACLAQWRLVDRDGGTVFVPSD